MQLSHPGAKLYLNFKKQHNHLLFLVGTCSKKSSHFLSWKNLVKLHNPWDMGLKIWAFFHCLGHFNHYPILFIWNSWSICANLLFSGLCVLQSDASFSIWSFPQFMGGFSWPEGDIKKTFCSPASGRRRQSEWHCVKSGRLTLNWLSVHCLCFEE